MKTMITFIGNRLLMVPTLLCVAGFFLLLGVLFLLVLTLGLLAVPLGLFGGLLVELMKLLSRSSSEVDSFIEQILGKDWKKKYRSFSDTDSP